MRPERYFHIPWDYASWLRGLRWAEQADAIVDGDGQTFLMAKQAALFLEGFVASSRLIHFAYVLHLMKLLGLTRHGDEPQPKMLWDLFHQHLGNVRNAGAFAAVLCADAPSVADPAILDRAKPLWFSSATLMTWLCSATDEGLVYAIPEALPFKAADFEQRVKQALERYTLQEIAHWFHHGRGAIHGAGEQLAEELAATKPRTLAGVLAALTQRQRLAGAVPFVAQLVSALTLPPRRLAQNELPLGGYADVTTRGQPEHLLPSQFALDDLEFVRRFAGGELLYFRREEPHAPLREELVVLLDQGARTWGDVRLVLGAAVFALGNRCVTRKLPLLVGATSNDGRLLDPLTADAEALGELLEASDLSLHPALALETVLRVPTTAARDIVLLTHPRNLAEAEVAAAARCLQAGSRLFALTVDDAGRADLAELRHGVPVAIAQFRIDWALKATENLPLPPVIGAAPEGWRGNVEPIPFPFRFGLTSRPTHFAFDQAGDILLIASGNGILHAHHTDGSLTEVLPRGMLHNDVLTHVEGVLGLPGGFVVVGRLEMEQVAFHYHWPTRSCVAHILGAHDGKSWEWFYFAEFHCVVTRSSAAAFGVDLATGERGFSRRVKEAEPTTRAQRACQEAWGWLLPPPWVYLANGHYVDPDREQKGLTAENSLVMLDGDSEQFNPEWNRVCRKLMVHVNGATGELTFGQTRIGWSQWTPQADGLAIFRGARLWSAQFNGSILALLSSPLKKVGKATLRLFQLPTGTLLRELPHSVHWHCVLSPDGRLLARQTAETHVLIDSAMGGGTAISAVPAGGCHNNLEVELGNYWMTLRIGTRTHLLNWQYGDLHVETLSNANPDDVRKRMRASCVAPNQAATKATDVNWSQVHYDGKRFVRAHWNALVAVVDCFGQIALFSQRQELLCMFFAYRETLAAWMPDGTRFGPASITGWSQTPDALARIGRVLNTASGGTIRTRGRPAP